MINTDNGDIALTSRVKLTKASELGKMQLAGLGEAQKLRDMGNYYQWLDIKNLKIEDHYFNFQLCFFKTLLKEIHVVLQKEKFDLNNSWGNWSEEFERNQLEYFNQWLDDSIGKKRTFKWGEISSLYDQKSAQSFICILYN